MNTLLPDETTITFPAITTGVTHMPLRVDVLEKLYRVVVDTHLLLPDMFELSFHDDEGTLVDKSGLSIGTLVNISGAAPGEMTGKPLITGEVTSIEAVCVDAQITTVVRGYDKTHRLQRAKRSRTWLNTTDADIAREIVTDAGLVGRIDPTTNVHEVLSQTAQTDWEFLVERATEIGYELGIGADGVFYFRKASDEAAGGLGGVGGALASAAAGALGLSSKLSFKDNLYTFLPRVSGANLTPQVEVRVWDPMNAKVIIGKSEAATSTAQLPGDDPQKLATKFAGAGLPVSVPSVPVSLPGMPKLDFGPPPDNSAYVVVNRPVGSGPTASRSADEAAKAIANQVSGTFAEAEGDARGDPDLKAGAKVRIEGVPTPFIGTWTVTNAKHIWGDEENYHVRFWSSGRSDRSLLGLSSGPASGSRSTPFTDLVCGIVSNLKDPMRKGRVKVTLPWLAPDYESDWARVVHVSAGPKSGVQFLPDVGDEVLVGFEFGDARRPYVLGSLINTNSAFAPLGESVDPSGKVKGRGITAPSGTGLQFVDDVPSPSGKPITSQLTLGTGDGKIALAIDQVQGTISITCKPEPPNSNGTGAITIDCSSAAGKVEVKAGTGGVSVQSKGQLELSGETGVKISSNANVQISGTGVVEVKGQMVKLN